MDIGADLRRAYEDGYADGKREAAPKWISVEERLPEVGQEYMTFRQFDGTMEVLHHKGDGVFGGLEGLYVVYAITHWMPLPEPPKEEE